MNKLKETKAMFFIKCTLNLIFTQTSNIRLLTYFTILLI